MAKILFTWELGGGSGHVAPYIELITLLIKNGHEIHFALKTIHKAAEYFRDVPVKWYQAPSIHPSFIDKKPPVQGFAKILYHAGHNSCVNSSSLINAWKNLFKLVEPDLIIFDYSPTAMLAAKDLPIKTLGIGTGFHLRPKIEPMPSVVPLTTTKEIEAELSLENNVLNVINAALESLSAKKINKLYEVMTANKLLLKTIPELDHFPQRENGLYYGVLSSKSGQLPEWPSNSHKKLFAYLKPFVGLEALLSHIHDNNYSALIYPDKIPKSIIEKYSSDLIIFSKKPLDMHEIGISADAAICNANHGSTAELLLSGVPLLLIPLQGEQQLVARCVERLKAGILAPAKQPNAIINALEKILNDNSFKESALRFSRKYENTKYLQAHLTIKSEIEKVLSEAQLS